MQTGIEEIVLMLLAGLVTNNLTKKSLSFSANFTLENSFPDVKLNHNMKNLPHSKRFVKQ